MIEFEKPNIHKVEETDNYGKFVVEPLERGYGTTLGNSLRRVMMASLPGAAITSIQIDGVLHEFSTVQGVTEDVTQIILNLKKVSLKIESEDAKDLELDVKGPAEVTAGDIQGDGDVTILNPDLHIATVADGAELHIMMTADKGRGYVATVLVSNGTLKMGDIVLAGTSYGKVKAMFNERNQRLKEAGPSEPALILGLNGAPAAGDTFHVIETEQEAREIANKREQLQREQGLRTQKMLTLDEVGRRLALGDFHELNIIVKGDVDGSVEALSDSLIKLSTEQVQVNVIHKGVGAISESDVSLAAASDAIIVGFQVRPSGAAAKLAEQEGVDIRKYSVIYDAIEEVKAAMEGMLAPTLKEQVTATIEVREVFNITKVGLVAGAMVKTGKVKRSDKARLIRDGIVIFTGNINALKRFKDDVKEVGTNFECGISLTNCNDIKVGDIIESYEEVEVKQTL